MFASLKVSFLVSYYINMFCLYSCRQACGFYAYLNPRVPSRSPSVRLAGRSLSMKPPHAWDRAHFLPAEVEPHQEKNHETQGFTIGAKDQGTNKDDFQDVDALLPQKCLRFRPVSLLWGTDMLACPECISTRWSLPSGGLRILVHGACGGPVDFPSCFAG